ncbi:DUF6906 family protein [Clostridium cuniculi]|uniref:DUF6906 family protein n=1 Tax=Clostridium cuniculi TaxID=2548455 RepID=UPI001055C960|nr:hypothetical protein [Clostridium cuniculi]
MLFNKLLELHGELTHKEYELLLKVAKDDIEFGKSLGIEYTDNKILNVINNTVNVIKRLDINQLKNLNEEQKKFLMNEGLDPREFLLERVTAESYVFYNIHTKVLWNFRK